MKLGLLALVAIAACHTTAPATSPTRADLLASACLHLRELGCPEGSPNRKGTSCEAVMAKAEHLADVPATCIIQAWDVTEVRACGDLTTVRVKCATP